MSSAPQRLDRGRELGRARAVDVERHAGRPGVATSPIANACASLGLGRALGPERDERRRGDVRDLVGVGDRIGAPIGSPISDRRRRARPAQSSDATRLTAGGPLSPPWDGIGGERRAGGVGGGVDAADPGRVLGREAGEAELLGGVGALLLAATRRPSAPARAATSSSLERAGSADAGAGEQRQRAEATSGGDPWPAARRSGESTARER